MTQHTDVAGPSGYGPKVTVRRSCSDCKACNSESYAVQGDSGHYVYCEHPSLPERKYIGDTRWDTPGWCPVAAPTTQPAPQQEAQEPCPTCIALARTVMLDQVSFDRKPDCYGIRQITDDEGVEEWEDIRTSPDVAREEANDMMATGRGEIYEVVPLWTTRSPPRRRPSLNRAPSLFRRTARPMRIQRVTTLARRLQPRRRRRPGRCR